MTRSLLKIFELFLCVTSVFCVRFNCSEDFFEDVVVVKQIENQKFEPSIENRTNLEKESVLEVVDGSIPILCDGDFSFPHLIHIKLADREIEEIEVGAFKNAPMLTEINLRNNL